jgi:hypothetical protein
LYLSFLINACTVDFEDRSLPSSDDEGEIQAPLAAKATKISLPKRPNDSNGGNDGPLAKKQKLVKMATLEQLAVSLIVANCESRS